LQTVNNGYKLNQNKYLSFVTFDSLNNEGIINACTYKWADLTQKKKILNFSKNQQNKIYFKNLKLLNNCLKIKPDNIAVCKQVHSTNTAIVESNAPIPEDRVLIHNSTDALITLKQNVMLLITTADCVPIFIYEPEKKIIANIHAGWRGTRQNILSSTIKTLIDRFKVKPENCILCLGPSIGQCCFEVSNYVASLFKDDYGAEYLRLNDKTGKNHVDLKAVNIDVALSLGIKNGNIFNCNICTCCNENFFSYRRDGLVGLSANILMSK